MARRRRKRYREYRGKRQRSGSTVLKVIIVLLALLLILGVLFVVFLGEYVEYTDGGVRVNLPWFQAEEPEDPVASDPLIIVTPVPSQQPEEDVLAALNAVEVTAAQVADGTAAEVVTAAGGTALVVEMKNAYGRLNWKSEVEQAARASSAIGEDVARAVRELDKDGTLYLVARVNCFRDQILAAAKIGGPLMTRGGNIWYDAKGLCWVSPTVSDVREYLIALCMELAELGFDEVLLECAGFPYFGETHVLAQSELRPEDLTTPVETFWQELKNRLAEEGVMMSVLVTEAMVAGTDEYSGIDAGLMARFADRVWVEAPEAEGLDYAQLLEQAGMEAPERRLVMIGASAGNAEESWAIMKGPAR